MRGPHGFHSTEPSSPPFEFTNAGNVAGALTENSGASYATVAREQIVEWDPEVIFIDMSTIRLGEAVFESMNAAFGSAVFEKLNVH